MRLGKSLRFKKRKKNGKAKRNKWPQLGEKNEYVNYITSLITVVDKVVIELEVRAPRIFQVRSGVYFQLVWTQ